MKVGTREIALVTTMAALQVALDTYKIGFPVIGIEGAKISIISSIVPIFGILLGPWLGASAALLGAATSRVVTGASFISWLLIATTPLSAFVAGCLSRRRVGMIRGWMISVFVLGGLIATWYGTWAGRAVLAFSFLHWAALAAILIFRERLAFFIERGITAELLVSVILCAFSANMVAQMYGTLVFLVAADSGLVKVSLNAAFFEFLIPVFAVERLTVTGISAILGVPIIKALRHVKNAGYTRLRKSERTHEAL
ncbi:MAG: hypothetical protein JSV64_06500 [Candidatus Bathyarchaeota archaeon]|nr:MAG: hypothetical protein JSV64_06500 [Candidatus Bathyarchaeota archaeon]